MHADERSRRSESRSSWWGLLFKGFVSVALLAFLLSRTDLGRLWREMRSASLVWLAVALGIYLLMILASAWRWGQLLSAQGFAVRSIVLVRSYLVATFFNNFLPSNIGGDVIRISDTVRPTGSRTLATTIVLLDRAIGLIGLLIVLAVATSLVQGVAGGRTIVWPSLVWLGCGVALAGLVTIVLVPSRAIGLLSPLRIFNPEWVDTRLARMTDAFAQFRREPWALVNCLAGAVVVQVILVGFHLAVATSAQVPISFTHLAVLIPLSFVVQMLPISINGLGVREATFTYYFDALGLPLESALVLSFLGTATILVFSLSGAATYLLPQH